jgi:hypothetical protein
LFFLLGDNRSFRFIAPQETSRFLEQPSEKNQAKDPDRPEKNKKDQKVLKEIFCREDHLATSDCLSCFEALRPDAQGIPRLGKKRVSASLREFAPDTTSLATL